MRNGAPNISAVLLALAVGLAACIGGCPGTSGPTPTTLPAAADPNSAAGRVEPPAGDGALEIPNEVGLFAHSASLREGLHSPARIAITKDGTVLVTDPSADRVARFDAADQALPAWSIPGGPLGIALSADGARVFISLRDERRVAIHSYDPATDAFTFSGEYLGGADTPFRRPTDLAVEPASSDVYVVDSEADRVLRFDKAGTLVAELGERGIGIGQFKYPSAIAVNPTNATLYVADQDNWRVQAFDSSGRVLGTFGGRMEQVGEESRAWLPRTLGLTADNTGHVYAADALLGAVRVFDATGTDLGQVVSFGAAAPGVQTAVGLAISPDGRRLYVASVGTSSVEVYELPAVLANAPTTQPSWPAVPPGPVPEPLPDRAEDWEGHETDGEVVCKRCHGLTGQPGEHLGTVEGQAALCLSCHNAAGQALNTPLHAAERADPFGANPELPDQLGRSHAWGVPAVNPAAGSAGPRPGGAMTRYLASGMIKCTTCHNPHDHNDGRPYLRVFNAHDALCKECHAPFVRAPVEPGAHPVGRAYPGGTGEFPAVDALPLPTQAGWLECTTCHAVHGGNGASAGGGNGRLLRAADGATLCQACHAEHAIHTVRGDWQPTCRDCHTVHDAESHNLALVARQVRGTPVTFADRDFWDDGRDDFVHVDREPPAFDGVCEVCHTATRHYRNGPGGEDGHYRTSRMRCTDCHQHRFGFIPWCVGCHTGA